MCEFTVLLGEEVVARKVIKARIRDGVLMLSDTSGTKTVLKEVSIVGVDTIMAELTLRRNEGH
ncbi:MAG: CooT family nickel-binding protein [Candidatus Methanomethylophilaceae archaeon]|jgi:predicted RNA-binding protein|nr:CooT family nickel-binding protein [Candidatus Methanomethylophilaceae archaeon]NLF33524.1 CooT family nickel-binding protein [Thermoplasmatales archaeon]